MEKKINLNIINKNSYQKYFYNKLKSYTTNNIVLTKYNSFGTYKQSKICLSHFQILIVFSTVAFNRTAILSSEFDEMHKASNAVDGIKMCFSYNLVASSSRSTQPWLLIQLDAIYSIGKVVVYARNDRYGMWNQSVTEKEKCYIHYIDNIMRVVWKLLRQHKYLPFNDEFY